MKALGIVVVVLLIVVLVGWIAGWLEFSSESRAGGREVSVRIDQDEISSDTAAVKDRVTGATRDVLEEDEDEVPTATDGEPLVADGTIVSLSDDSLTVADADGQHVTYVLGEGTVIEIDGSAGDVSGLAVGDEVTVWVDDTQSGAAALRVVVEH